MRGGDILANTTRILWTFQKYHLSYNEISEQTVAELEQMSLNDLATHISEAVQAELLMYCADEYAIQPLLILLFNPTLLLFTLYKDMCYHSALAIVVITPIVGWIVHHIGERLTATLDIHRG